MTYFFKKYKFTSGLFSKKIDHAVVEHTEDIFRVQIMPYFNFGGTYYINGVSKKDNERTIYATKKSRNPNTDMDIFEFLEDFFISLSHDGGKVMIFTHSGEGIILLN